MKPNDKLEIFRDAAGLWRWRVRAGNHKVISTSGEFFDSKSNAKRAGIRVTGAEDGRIIIDEQ